jgi:hypothetical protein
MYRNVYINIHTYIHMYKQIYIYVYIYLYVIPFPKSLTEKVTNPLILVLKETVRRTRPLGSLYWIALSSSLESTLYI